MTRGMRRLKRGMKSPPQAKDPANQGGTGKGLARPPAMTRARFSSRKEAAMAEINSEIRGARRSGRYAPRSSSTPMRPVSPTARPKAAGQGQANSPTPMTAT